MKKEINFNGKFAGHQGDVQLLSIDAVPCKENSQNIYC